MGTADNHIQAGVEKHLSGEVLASLLTALDVAHSDGAINFLRDALITAFISQMRTMEDDQVKPDRHHRRLQITKIAENAAKLAELLREYLPDIKDDEFAANYYSANPRPRRRQAAKAHASNLAVVEDIASTCEFILANPPFSALEQQPGSRHDPAEEGNQQSGSYPALRFAMSMAKIYHALTGNTPKSSKNVPTAYQTFVSDAFGVFADAYNASSAFAPGGRPYGPIRRAPGLRDHAKAVLLFKERLGG